MARKRTEEERKRMSEAVRASHASGTRKKRGPWLENININDITDEDLQSIIKSLDDLIRP